MALVSQPEETEPQKTGDAADAVRTAKGSCSGPKFRPQAMPSGLLAASGIEISSLELEVRRRVEEWATGFISAAQPASPVTHHSARLPRGHPVLTLYSPKSDNWGQSLTSGIIGDSP